MTRYIKQITWARWRYQDSNGTKFFTNFTVSIPRPSFEFPAAFAMMSVVGGRGKALIRFTSLEAVRQLFVIPVEYLERLEEGYLTALEEAEKIQTQLKAIMKMRSLRDGDKIVNTGTGEILAEAEQILQEKGI